MNYFCLYSFKLQFIFGCTREGFVLFVNTEYHVFKKCWLYYHCNTRNYRQSILYLSGPGSVVGIATGYRLDGPGIASRWGRDFPHLSSPTLGPTQPPVKWVPGFSRGKERPGRDADHSHTSSAVVMKE